MTRTLPALLLIFLFGMLLGGMMTFSALSAHPPATGSSFAAAMQTRSADAERAAAVVAVDQSSHTGIMGNVSVHIVQGTGKILVNIDPFIEPDVQQSAQIAARVAQKKTGMTLENNDVVFTYHMPEEKVQIVGGASAGAATAVAVIAAMQNKTLRPHIAMTGTINADGSIGPVGGILEKAKASADAGYKTFLVPEGEAVITYYERLPRPSAHGFRRVEHTIDVREEAKEWGLTVKEISTIDEAIQEMIE